MRAIEARDTRIERGSAVLVHTGWDRPGYLEADELHFPGSGRALPSCS